MYMTCDALVPFALIATVTTFLNVRGEASIDIAGAIYNALERPSIALGPVPFLPPPKVPKDVRLGLLRRRFLRHRVYPDPAFFVSPSAIDKALANGPGRPKAFREPASTGQRTRRHTWGSPP